MGNNFKLCNRKKLLISLSVPFAVAGIIIFIFGAYKLFCAPSEVIKTPVFFPKGNLYFILWSVSITLFGFSSYRIITSITTVSARKNALATYIIALMLYPFWAIIFFLMGEYCFAFIWFIAILFFVFDTYLRFVKIDKLSGYLVIPFFAMTVFTGYLNLGIWILN